MTHDSERIKCPHAEAGACSLCYKYGKERIKQLEREKLALENLLTKSHGVAIIDLAGKLYDLEEECAELRAKNELLDAEAEANLETAHQMMAERDSLKEEVERLTLARNCSIRRKTDGLVVSHAAHIDDLEHSLEEWSEGLGKVKEALKPFAEGFHERVIDDPKAVGYDHCICRCDGMRTKYPCKYVKAREALAILNERMK